MRFLLLPLLASSLVASAQTPSVPTIKASARLVVVDVVVTDKHNQPIGNLKQSDFSVSEDKAPQSIRNFEEHTGATTTLAPPAASKPGVFTNYTASPDFKATNVLLLDSVDTAPADQATLVAQLKRFLETVPPGTRIAIFGLRTSLVMLQGFTSDPKLLLAAFNQKGLTSPAFAGDNPENSANEPFLQMIELANQPLIQQRGYADAMQLRARSITRAALEQLARYLAVIPGRKNLIWFAGSFPLQLTGRIADGNSTVPDESYQTERLTNLFLASRIAVYPVQATGLAMPAGMGADSRGTFSGQAASAQQSTRLGVDSDKIFAMQQIAEDTGGRVFINTNQLTDAVSAAVSDGSRYYTIAYTPTNAAVDGTLRNIHIDVTQRGLNLAYRRLYYAPEAKESSAKTAALLPDHLRSAMVHGAPEATELIFRARVLPASAALEDQPVEGNHPNPKPEIMKGPYRRLQVDLAVDLHPLLVRMTPQGLVQLNVQYSTCIYDRDGVLINEAGATLRPAFTVENFKEALDTGVAYHQQISAPAKGEYFVRIGFHDLTGDKIGSVEFPLSSVINLPPLAQP